MPSGHATAAFAMATVLADRHPKQKWLFYTLAASVAFARIQKERHFLSDVFVGGAIGMYGARRVLANEDQILTWRF
jgi:undecaprenyl-diphosphatase